MGYSQQFTIAVPELKEYVGDATLGTSIEDEYPGTFLVQQLAVPVPLRLPNEVSALERPLPDHAVHQEHITSALERKANREILRSRRNRKYKTRPKSSVLVPRTVLGDKNPNVKIQAIKHENNDKVRKLSVKKAKFTPSTELLGLMTLPAELQLNVLKMMDLQDFHPLCLANSTICRRARVVLEERYHSKLGQWAGKSIICVGERTAPGDYPKGALGDGLKMALSTIDQFIVDEKDFEGQGEADGNFYSPVTDCIHDWPDKQERMFWIPTVFEHNYKVNGKPPSDVDFMVDISDKKQTDILSLSESRFYPKDQAWILRNLTTKEFVRADGIAESEQIRGPFISGFGFGELVLLRTAWSTVDDLDCGANLNMHRGVWAGHAFDITTTTRHESTTKKEVWHDISNNVKQEIDAFMTKFDDFGP